MKVFNLMATLYYTDIKCLSLDDESLLSRLTQERLNKINRFRFEADKLRSLAADLLIHYVYHDLSLLKFNQYKKPYIKNGLPFNVSHSGDYVILLVGDGEEVGCDIEKNSDKDMTGVAERILHPKEKRDFSYKNKKDPLIFYQYWTLKESYMKCVGKGFHLYPESFALDLSKEISIIETPEKEFRDCTFNVLDILSGYTVATCRKGSDLPFLTTKNIKF